MKKFFFFLSAGTMFFLTACNDNSTVKGMNDKDSTGSKMESSSAEAKEERNKQTVMAMYEQMNKHDVNMAFKDCAPDVKDYGDGSTKPLVSLDSLKSFIGMWFTTFPDFKAENLKFVSEGDWVMVYGDYSGTWKGDFMGQKPTGKQFKLKDADVFHLNDEGKITEHRNVQPFSAIAQQVGMKM